MRDNLFVVIFVSCLALMMSSCNSHTYSIKSEIDQGCWAVNDTLDLSFLNEDTVSLYQLSFPLTVTEDYPFNNIYLRAQVVAPSGDKYIVPSRFELADESGAWYSEQSGEKIPFSLNLSDAIRFNQAGEYHIRLYHFMRNDPLCGVYQAGIALDKLETN